ncbi:Rsp5p-dependent ubiquitination, sorting of cargo proteins at the multivesicular body [Haplosporangium sp. Z 767]|nr:Rsp5p-dependent ubiquitination, sorting of cargo proteins at the multivesicular body [Haplosporangium sp. Z 767]
MSFAARARQLRERARQPLEPLEEKGQWPKPIEKGADSQEKEPTHATLERWQRELDSLDLFQRQQQLHNEQQRLSQQPSYLNSIAAPAPRTDSVPQADSFSSLPSFITLSSDDTQFPPDLPSNGGGEQEDDATWLIAVVLTTALLLTIASLIRSCCQIAGGLPSILQRRNDRQAGVGSSGASGHNGSGHGHGPNNGGSSRRPGSGPVQVPGEDEPDPYLPVNEDDERWALLTDAQRQAYDSAQAFQDAHPPLSVPTDISLSQYLSIQEKGVSAWEFEESSYDNHRVQVHDRTELLFPRMVNQDQQQLEASVQTNLPMPKQQEVYYWEVKMFEKHPDTVVAVGVSTKPYPHSRMPGWNRHSVAYFSLAGQKFYNSPFSGIPYGPIYYEGDVIGCGYRPRTGTIFFTRNGKRLEDAYTGLRFNLFPTVGASGPCALHVNFGQSGFVFVEANVKKWGLAPANGSLAPPPAYGSERGSILLEAGSTAATTRTPAPPTRRPKLQSAQSRARIEAAGVLVQIDEDEGTGESGSDYSNGIAFNAKRASVPRQHISLANMSVPSHSTHGPPPHYSSLDGTAEGSSTRDERHNSTESDDETTALIAETISRPVGERGRAGRSRSGTTTSVASASGIRR